MARQLTWYDVLDVLPGASAYEVQRAFEVKESLLSPTLISGAPSKVVSAAERARTAIKAARDVLTDPASRQRYDDEIGIRQTGGGLTGQAVEAPGPSEAQLDACRHGRDPLPIP